LWVSTKHPSKECNKIPWYTKKKWVQSTCTAKVMVVDQCWVVLWIYKELLVLVLWKFQNHRIINSSFSKKIQNPRTASSSYFRSLTRTHSFHERIESSLANYLTFYIFWKAWLYTKVSSLHCFKNQQVNVFIPRLITNGHLSLILRTAQH